MKNKKMNRMALWSLLLVTAMAPAWGQTPQFVINTFAGGGPGNGTAATNAAIVYPNGVARDASGNIYFSTYCGLGNPGISRVFVIDVNGLLTAVAGTGATGFSGDGGPAPSASLNSPCGIALDSSGNLYIADTSNNRIRKVSNGIITTVAGNGTPGFTGDGGSATAAELNGPYGVAVDNAGHIYIADSGNNRIREVVNGTISTVAGNGTAGFDGDGSPAAAHALNNPLAVAVDSAGTNIYIPDTYNSRIRKVTGGAISTLAGNGTQGFSGDGGSAVSSVLNKPTGITVDVAGNIYFSDDGNNRVREIAGGNINTVAGDGVAGFSGDNGQATAAELSFPNGVIVDSSGNLYIADSTNHRIRKVAGGVITTIAGNGNLLFSGDQGQAVAATLYFPSGVATDSAGNLYIADRSNNRVRKVATNGIITTVAGNGTAGYSGDQGPATSAELNGPFGVAVDTSGNLYIADAGNNRIREVTTNGTINTVAGNGIPGYSGDNGPATSAELQSPFGVALDTGGNLYIADSANNRVRKVTSGTITTVAGGASQGYSGDGGPATSAGLHNPTGIVLDSSGDLFIADRLNFAIRKVTNGTITTIAGNGTQGYSGDGGSATAASLSLPYAVALDSSANVYIADAGSSRIREVAGGIINTIAGSGNQALGDGGAATNAYLANPQGIALDSHGNIYIADTNDNRIRILAPSGTTATLSSLSPSSALAGSAAFTITINGSNFLNGATAQWNGTNMTTAFVSASQINATVTANLVAAAGTASVTVVNPSSIASNALTFTVTGTGGSLSLSPGSVQFGAVSGGRIVTSPQSIEVTAPAGAGWIASANSSFISVSPSSGTGSGSFTVSVIGGALPSSGSVTGQVTVTASGVSNSPQALNVSATIVTSSQIIGSFDTPVNNTTGAAGAVAVTGWALDSIEVTKVDIWREPIGAEGTNLVLIGNAVFVQGARPDVETAYPNLPFKNRAGWGYLMLTNFLPNNGGSPGLGNGTYKLHAIAHNAAGASVDLGTRTITCDNAHATKPFGTIDTPGQGATVSGSAFVNFGWALTQNPYIIPTDGSTITVTVDGVTLGHPVYNNFRQDIASSFPGLANTNGAVGYFYLDTTTLTNGVHTIGWLVYDNAGRGDGIGSRFFNVLNSSQVGSLVQPSLSRRSQGVKLRRGYDLTRKLESLAAGRDGTYSVTMEELGRIELNVGAEEGFLQVNGERRTLPAGSTLKDGVFYWQLGPGFLGSYSLQFVRSDGSIVPVRVIVNPKAQASQAGEPRGNQ